MIPTIRTPSMANTHREAGFTLLEMLVVVFILAVLAGSALIVYDGIAEDAQIAVAQAEMAELKKALLRFRQDTGYLPRQTTGPFIYENILPEHFPSSVPEAERQAWFDSEYNLWLLYGRDDVADEKLYPSGEANAVKVRTVTFVPHADKPTVYWPLE